MLRKAAGVALLLVVAVLATFVLYRQTLEYGFDFDDYHFIRPYSVREIATSFHGPWDPSGIERPYFRPLTVAAFAARFELLGLNSRAYHALSLGLFALAALLAGALVWGFTRALPAALLATLLFAIHPSMPYALAAWVTNQMHVVEIIAILSALVWWNVVRARGLIWWMPLLVAATAAFLIKEDGVMLLPAIITLHWLRRRLIEPELPPLPRPWLIAAAVLIGMLVTVRTGALSGLHGWVRPTAAQAWTNVSKGLDGVFRLVPPKRPWQPAASWFATLLPLAGLAVWRRASPGARYCLAAGAAIAVLFSLPFLFVTKGEQMHVVALGAVMVLVGSAEALLSAVSLRGAHMVVAVIVAGGSITFGLVARDISTDFAPFGPIVLAHDSIVRGWAAVPSELREYLARKLETGAERTLSPNPGDSLDLVVFGVHPPETSPTGLRYYWMSSARAEIDVAASAREVVIPLRHEAGAFGEPARADISADGRRLDSLVLSDGAWRVSQIPLRRAGVSSVARMHRIVVSIDHAWVPAAIIPHSNDTRVLGLQIGTIQVRF